MKKIYVTTLLLLLAPAMAMAQNPYALISCACPSGQILYYGVDPNGRGASLTWPNYENGDYWAGYTKPTGRVIIPDSVTWVYNDSTHILPVYSVSQNCFNGCSGITSVVFPETIIAFEPNAFAGCSSLDSIFMPQVPPELFSGQPIGMSPNAAFYIPCGTWQAYHDAHYYTIHTGNSHPPCLEPEAEDITLTLLPEDEEKGEARNNTPGVRDYVRCDSIVVIYAQGYHPYQFDHWSNGHTQNPDTLYLTESTTITAYFRFSDFQITGLSVPTEGGTILGTGTYTYLDTIVVTAQPNAGYHFLRWYDYSTENPRTHVVEDAYQFVAYFEEGEVSINDVIPNDVNVFANGNRIVVTGADGMRVQVFSVDGRCVNNENLHKGVYVVKVGDMPARKVVITKD